MTNTTLEQRALSAYYKTGSTTGGSVIQPGAVETIEVNGLSYIRLSNTNGVLAVYRIRTVNGEKVLRGLKRWPKELNEV